MGTTGARSCARCHRAGGAANVVAGLSRGAERAAIPWERVYEVPHFVRFDHRRHRTAGCELCHGSVERSDRTKREVEITMKFCRSCHLRSGAKAACGTCHEDR
ncbi:MAG: cytochrome c3 family protein [Bryobacteraceae bacterium]